MLTDDLIASLNGRAGDVQQPGSDLLSLVEQHADRLRRRRIAAVAGAMAATMLLVTVGAVAITRNGTHPSSLRPAAGPAISLCDSPKAAPPINYLDWPCATPAGQGTQARVATLVAQASHQFPRVRHWSARLLADARGAIDRAPRSDWTTAVELWDADSTSPSRLFVLNNGSQSGLTGFNAVVPTGQPVVLAIPELEDLTHRLVIARADVTEVALDGDGKQAGASVVAGFSEVAAVPDGPERPGWVVQARGGGDLLGMTGYETLNGSDSTDVCGSQTDPTTCGAADVTPPRLICDEPGSNVPEQYLDWPCVTAADSQTQHRIAVTLADVLSRYTDIATPKIRLLVDHVADGRATTILEVWDAIRHQPAVLAGVESPQSGEPGALDTQNFQVIPEHDPGVIEAGTQYGSTVHVYARSDVASVSVPVQGAATLTASVHGGLAVLDIPISLVQSRRVDELDGLDAGGHIVTTSALDPGACIIGNPAPCNPFATP